MKRLNLATGATAPRARFLRATTFLEEKFSRSMASSLTSTIGSSTESGRTERSIDRILRKKIAATNIEDG